MEEDDSYYPKLKYLGDYPKLPIDAPVGHPHLVDPASVDEEYPQQSLTVADLVVTILFKFMPEALTAFLDLERPKVLYIQGGKKGTRLDFCIKRDKRVVTIGFLNEKEIGGWSIQHQYRITGKATEMWTPIRFSIEVHNVTKAEEVQERAPFFAFNVFSMGPWSRASGQDIEWVSGLSQGRSF